TVTVADRAQFQAGAAAEQEPAHAEEQSQRQVECQILPEQDGSDERNVGEVWNDDRREANARYANIALTQHSRYPKAEDRQRQASRHLVCDQREGKETEQQ